MKRSKTERSTDRSIDARTPTETTPARLPTPPRLPGGVKPPVLPPAPAARPGRRGEAPSELIVTSRVERITVEPTPAPLPPSPAAADADRWFEQVPTNPGAPTTVPDRKHPTGRVAHIDPTLPHPRRETPAWLFPLLLALTALTVGMVIGALVFGGAQAPASCPPCDAGVTR
ncbi:MAG: hypothetical protein HS111_08145 [Kofleriaceae bacterium]|nr:hypothetical protein [Kofleriaceae bacterium]MCL4223722.1 hypothetical protein [Myxococcales bacterium]